MITQRQAVRWHIRQKRIPKNDNRMVLRSMLRKSLKALYLVRSVSL